MIDAELVSAGGFLDRKFTAPHHGMTLIARKQAVQDVMDHNSGDFSLF